MPCLTYSYSVEGITTPKNLAPDYKSGEEVLKKVCEKAVATIKKLGGEGTYYRESKK